jgi:hypothetical protein
MKSLKLKYLVSSMATVVAASLLVSGCAWSIGGGREGEQTVQATKGQELMDLKRAKDTGAISEAEYETQKQRILNK